MATPTWTKNVFVPVRGAPLLKATDLVREHGDLLEHVLKNPDL